MQDFLRHINLDNQKFKCYLNSDKKESLNLAVDIYNILKNGATSNDILLLQELIPNNNEQIVELYKIYNGIKLYCSGNASGLEFYAINDLKKLNEEWKESFSYYNEEELYDFQKYGVAFGEISHSGNYFILYNGKVFYSDHEEWDEALIGNSFDEFLSKIVTDPADFLYKMGCYTRYSDGKTNGQWIPKVFTANEN